MSDLAARLVAAEARAARLTEERDEARSVNGWLGHARMKAARDDAVTRAAEAETLYAQLAQTAPYSEVLSLRALAARYQTALREIADGRYPLASGKARDALASGEPPAPPGQATSGGTGLGAGASESEEA